MQLDQSATRRRGGTGMGLHLCRQLASVLGAEVALERPSGGGASFRLRFPEVVLPNAEVGTLAADQHAGSDRESLVRAGKGCW